THRLAGFAGFTRRRGFLVCWDEHFRFNRGLGVRNLIAGRSLDCGRMLRQEGLYVLLRDPAAAPAAGHLTHVHPFLLSQPPGRRRESFFTFKYWGLRRVRRPAVGHHDGRGWGPLSAVPFGAFPISGFGPRCLFIDGPDHGTDGNRLARRNGNFELSG